MELVAADPLARLAEDVRVAAWLMPRHAPLRGYLELLASLPPESEAWEEVLGPWLPAARHGGGPAVDGRGEIAALGALGVAALRTVRDLPEDSALAPMLRTAARWCFFRVRPDAH